MILNIENRGNLVQGIGSSGHDRAERQRGAGETAWWLAAGGLEEKGYWSPTASITWRKVKPLRKRAMGETQTETALAWIRERARYALAFPLYAPSDLLSVPLIHQTQVEISGHRAWEAQPAGAAPPPEPRIRRHSVKHGFIWMQMRSSTNNICKSAHTLSQSVKCFLTRSICSPLPFFSSFLLPKP